MKETWSFNGVTDRVWPWIFIDVMTLSWLGHDLSHYLGHDIMNENLKAIYANAINNDARYNAPWISCAGFQESWNSFSGAWDSFFNVSLNSINIKASYEECLSAELYIMGNSAMTCSHKEYSLLAGWIYYYPFCNCTWCKTTVQCLVYKAPSNHELLSLIMRTKHTPHLPFN